MIWFNIQQIEVAEENIRMHGTGIIFAIFKAKMDEKFLEWKKRHESSD